MAPPKAPEAKGPSAGNTKGNSRKNKPLTSRELHQIVLRVVSFAALVDGPAVQVGSRGERFLHGFLRKIDELVDRAEKRVPLADTVDRRGNIIGGFRLGDFELIELSNALRHICKDQKKLLRTPKFKAKAFSDSLAVAFAVAGHPISSSEADQDVALIKARFYDAKPTEMAGVILARHGLPKARTVQYRKQSMPLAKQARGHLRLSRHEIDLITLQEFLTCIQITPSTVPLEAWLLLCKRQRRRKGHGDYSLRDLAIPVATLDPPPEWK
jgi:hypothetical protein